MVLNFASEGAFRSFDAQIGHRNLKLTFNTNNPAGNEGPSFLGKEFVARPSRNPRWIESDHDESVNGWIGGRGLTYQNSATGTLNPETGKVYQFCSNVNDPNDAGSLKPDPCTDFTFSGSRGPIALYSDTEFSVSIFEFNDRAGITDGGFLCCGDTTLGPNGWESCSSCGCPGVGCEDFGGDDPDCANPSCGD